MRISTLLFAVFFPLFAFAQSAGDTLVIPSINYSQTFSPQGRDTMILFPDDAEQSYERIIMSYNMRCKDGLVSTGGNTNLGCGEWDYKCNTFITDSARVDSILNFQNSHAITHFSGDTFYYVETPTKSYYQHLQKTVQLNSILSENTSAVGSGSLALNHVIAAEQHSGKSHFLFTAAELSAAGLVSGEVHGITLQALNSDDAAYFRVRLKNTDAASLEILAPDLDGFTEVYFSDYSFLPGENRIQFYTPFIWDGTSNIVVEYTFTNQNPSNQLSIQGQEAGPGYGRYTTNGTHVINDVGHTHLPAGPMANISQEITVSLWCNGNPDFLPANTSIIHGEDEAKNRTLNVHLPWSNSNIYFDCGWDGGYDRIEKGATPDEIEGRWNHWAFTKNAVSGDMKIYLNGELWHSGTGKTKPINIQDLVLGSNNAGLNNYFGKIDECRIWSTELDESLIKDWMNTSIDDSHPNYASLVAYYKFDEGTGTSTADASPYGETAQIVDYVLWAQQHGIDLSRNFMATGQRPNTTFLQGSYDLTITDNIVVEQIDNIGNVVSEYEIIPRYGTTLNDSINPVFTDIYWPAGYEYTYNPEGEIVDSTEVAATGYFAVSELTYYKRYPAKYEIMSFVTPYGINLDLGMEGKTWFFDLTDYAPILKGWKRLSVELGGQRQEDLDIRFFFIVGTPPRDIIDINQIWRASSSSYTNISNNRTFEPREFLMNPEGESFKVRSVITGHGQEGEFIGRWHILNIDGGDAEYLWKVWTECSTIPIYPQGGTWIYDRAGWCPGDPSDLYEYDITEYVSPGQIHTLDYGMSYASGTSNYQVNNQLVTYGDANFSLDAAIINISKPNSEIAAYERFNPACSYPLVLIQNTGSTPITSLNIEYSVQGGETLNYTWAGLLNFLDSAEVELVIPNYTFWSGDANKFTVNISNPNGQTDEYSHNNSYTIGFAEVDLYDVSETFTIECLTNNQGNQTSYALTDLEGNVIFEMDDLENNTVYTNEVSLELGCYKLRINDTGDNGLYFWHTPGFGAGYFRVKNSAGAIVKNFEPEFGRFAIYEFGVVDYTGTEELPDRANIVSIFPNPASDYVNLNLNGLNETKVKATLFNASMIKVYESQFSVSVDDFTKNIPMGKLYPGVYMLHLEYNGKTSINKIIKN